MQVTLLDPGASRSAVARMRQQHDVVIGLRRRGVHHGWVAIDGDSADASQAQDRWAAARPVHLPGLFAPYLDAAGPLLDASVACFDRLRGGARFLPEVQARLDVAERPATRVTSSTVDLLDRREIEKVYFDVDEAPLGAVRDAWAKLSWIADDESDLSLRVRFSCGVERLDEWVGDAVGAAGADDVAEALFPESAVIVEHGALREAVDALVGEPTRLSERIVYSNAPGGGAVFHHDADPGQRGVVYAQLSGWTAWLALSKRELAEHVAAHWADAQGGGGGGAEEALGALSGAGDESLWRLLNREPEFTARLVRADALRLLRAGDGLLLPSHGEHDVTWHAVFALGRSASLAHSYGIFAR